MGKLTADDTSIFMGLLNDIFSQTVEHVPRALDPSFEAKVSVHAAMLLLSRSIVLMQGTHVSSLVLK